LCFCLVFLLILPTFSNPTIANIEVLELNPRLFESPQLHLLKALSTFPKQTRTPSATEMKQTIMGWGCGTLKPVAELTIVLLNLSYTDRIKWLKCAEEPKKRHAEYTRGASLL
jgi:hypothetical protein